MGRHFPKCQASSQNCGVFHQPTPQHTPISAPCSPLQRLRLACTLLVGTKYIRDYGTTTTAPRNSRDACACA